MRIPCLGEGFGSRIKVQGVNLKSAEADAALTIREKVLGGMVHIWWGEYFGVPEGGGDVPETSGDVPRR